MPVVVVVRARLVLQVRAHGGLVIDPVGRRLKGGRRRAGDAPVTPVVHLAHVLDILAELAVNVVRKADILRLARIHHMLDGEDLEKSGIRIPVFGREVIDRVPVDTERLADNVLRLAAVRHGTDEQRPGPDAQALEFIDEKATVLLVAVHVLTDPRLELDAPATVVARLGAVGAAAFRCSVTHLLLAVAFGGPGVGVVLMRLLERRARSLVVTSLVTMTASNCSVVTHFLTLSVSLIFYNHYTKVERKSQAFLLCDFKDLQNTL